MKATAKDLRFHSREILDTVSRGEEVIITFRGKPQAKIIPLIEEENSIKGKSKLFGIWRDYQETEDVSKHVRKLRTGRFQ